MISTHEYKLTVISTREYKLSLTPQVEFAGREEVTSKIRKQEMYGDKVRLKEKERE